MTRISARTTRRGDRPSVRRAYRQRHQQCELSPVLRRLGVVDFTDDRATLQTHHIVGGAGRIDDPSNLIVVNLECHQWLEANTRDGRVACLYVKATKGELSQDVFRRAAGRSMFCWLSEAQPKALELLGVWRFLLTLVPSDTISEKQC